MPAGVDSSSFNPGAEHTGQDRTGQGSLDTREGWSRAPERQEFKTVAHLLQEGKTVLSRQQAQRLSSEVTAGQVRNFKERKKRGSLAS